MTELQEYLATEVVEDHSDGLISRREALRRLVMLGVGASAATSLLAACARDDDDEGAAPAATATLAPAATALPTTDIEFTGPNGKLMGAWAAAENGEGGGVLVIHENRGLTDHIKSLAGRFAAAGYSALALDLLSADGGTKAVGGEAEAMAALSKAPEERLVTDMKAGLDELARRLPDEKFAAVGFCFGGGMVWRLLNSGEPRLSAAVPFYGPAPDQPDFSGSKNAAVLGIYGEDDNFVNPTRERAEAALKEAGLEHELVTYKGAGHAFFNDTGMRYNADAASKAWTRVQGWFEEHLV